MFCSTHRGGLKSPTRDIGSEQVSEHMFCPFHMAFLLVRNRLRQAFVPAFEGHFMRRKIARGGTTAVCAFVSAVASTDMRPFFGHYQLLPSTEYNIALGSALTGSQAGQTTTGLPVADAGICQRPGGTVGWRGTVVSAAQYARASSRPAAMLLIILKCCFSSFRRAGPRRRTPATASATPHRASCCQSGNFIRGCGDEHQRPPPRQREASCPESL
jgi:hypothetical protein